MDDVKVCRICLNMDVKLFDLRAYPLECYYESVIGTNSLYTKLPPYACYECAALVKKFYFFKQRCLRGHAVLYGVSVDCGKLTPENITAIDTKGLNIASNLRVYSIKDTGTYNLSPYVEIKLEPEQSDKDKFKIEDNEYECFESMDHCVSSDDDQPLSLHKEKKSKNMDTESEDVELKDEAAATESAIVFLGSPDGEPKKCTTRGRGRKPKSQAKKLKNQALGLTTLTDIENYITVVTLTLEEQIEEINKRKESSNYVNSPYQCELCYKGFIDTEAWKHHVSKHSPSSGSLECIVCKFRFKTKRALQKHAGSHGKKYACKSCDYISTNTTQAKQHQAWHQGITFKCKYCDEIFSVWTSFMSHVRIKHPSEFICGVCGYSFVSKLGLAMHKTMMHKDVQEKSKEKDGNEEEEGPYCEECDVKFVSTEAYKRHLVMSVKHTESTDFIKGCRMCGATFDSSEEMRLHHRKQHARQRPRNYGKKPNKNNFPAKCEHCSEEISCAREYWVHFRRVHPDKKYPVRKDYVCDICGKSFRGNAFLVYHRRTHFEERAYKCAQCDKAFHNRTNLQVHEKTHSDLRPYPCSVCFKAFKGKAALDRHFRVHEELYSDVRPFPCSVCSKAFKFKGALDRHSLSHTGQKPYPCEVCGKAFSQSNSRKLHVRTVHLKQPAPYVSRSRLERRKQALKDNTQQPFPIY